MFTVLFAVIFSGAASACAPTPNLELTKTDCPDPVTAGEELKYTLTVSNTGAGDANGVKLADTLPAELTEAKYSLNNNDWYSYTSGQYINLGKIKKGEVKNVWIKGIVNPNTPEGTISNTASVYIENTKAGEATAKTTVITKSNMEVTKEDCPDPVVAGETIHYTMTVKNNGPSAAQSVTIADTLPSTIKDAQYSLDSINWLTYVSGDLINLGNFNVNQLKYFYIKGTVDPDALGTLHNVVNVYVCGKQSAQATADTTIINNAPLSITKTADKAEYNVGDTITYTIKVKNAGPSTAHNVIIKDTIPAGLQYISSDGGSLDSGILTWNMGDLKANGEITLTVTAKVLSEAAAIRNIVNTATAQHEFMECPVQAEATVKVLSSDLAITKSVDNAKPNVKDIINYTLIVNNLGPDTAVNVQVTDILPAGLSFVKYTANYGTYDPITGIWSIGKLPSGAKAELIITSIVENSGTIVNEAKVTSQTWDPNLNNNIATATINVENPQAAGGEDIPEVKAASNTVGMQETGIPVNRLILAIMAVLAGFIIPRIRN